MFFLFTFFGAPLPEPDSDEALLSAITRRQSAALGQLYDRYGKLVYSLAFRIVYDEGVAEEVTQEVFFQVWNKAESYQPRLGKVSTWLTSIARHRAIDVLRRRHTRPEGHKVDWEGEKEGEEPQWVDPVNVESQVELTIQGRTIRQAIAQLPQEQQHALALAYFQGLSHQEIADLTGEPLGTIKTRIRLAMQKLRETLQVNG